MKKQKRMLRLGRATLRKLGEGECKRVAAGLIASVFCTVDELGCGTYLSCITICNGDCSCE